MTQITCDNISVGYENKPVLSGLTLTVDAGDFLCITGENGSGKSTLLTTMLRLRAPLAGSVIYENGLKQNDIGYMPQQTEIQKDFPASVTEVVTSGFLGKNGLRPFYSGAEKKEAHANIDKLGISNLAKKCYRELSGGQQQRVLLARALCAAKKILFLDEPMSGLDPGASAEMYAIIDKLSSEGMTVIMISHDSNAFEHAGRMLHLGLGEQSPLYNGPREGYAAGYMQTNKRNGGGI